MTRDEFQQLLRKATNADLAFARSFIADPLPDAVMYRVILNQSLDTAAESDERLYPEDDGKGFDCLTEERVVDLLYREGRCPEWIDVSVEARSAAETRMLLLCCGRYSDDPKRMYYARAEMGPFGIKSPDLPFGYKEGQKFHVPKLRPCSAAPCMLERAVRAITRRCRRVEWIRLARVKLYRRLNVVPMKDFDGVRR